MGTRTVVRGVLILATLFLALAVLRARETTTQETDETRPRVQARFDFSTPDGGPFPSDMFTVPDSAQNTGRRVNMPYPDCGAGVSDCDDLNVINTLDGFGLQTRISIPFDGPIDPTSVSSQTVFVLPMGSYLPTGNPAGEIVGVNQIVFDQETNALHVETDALLEQASRYAVIVTDGVLDTYGVKVKASKQFRHLRTDVAGWYRNLLVQAIDAAKRRGIREQHIVAASVYSTQTITSVMERVRDGIKAGTPAPANFNLGPAGERAVFDLPNLTSVTWRQQNRVAPVSYATANLDLAPLRYLPGAIGTLAFGVYVSPEFLVHPGEYLPAVPTRTGTFPVQRYTTVAFDLLLPAGSRPPGGWPVAIIGHGSGSGRHTITWLMAASLAAHGIASIGINGYGFGFGPAGQLIVTRNDGTSLTIPDQGRSIDQDGNNVIGNGEGSVAAAPALNWTIGERDGYRQTVADLIQLVRVIEQGMDVDGDGSPELDAGRIYYFGNSAGERYGAILTALDPSVRAAVLAVSGGISPEHGRWAISRRSGLGRMLAARIPSLINSPGLTSIDGVPVAGPFYDENKPLRDKPPVINAVPGAMAIQQAFEMHEWGQQSGQTTQTWAIHLQQKPLPGVGARPVLVIFGRGDQNAVNPGTSALLRAGDLLASTIHYRHDLAYAEDPTVPKNPHDVCISPLSPNLTFRAVSRGIQDAIAIFLSSDGQMIAQPNPMRFFEVPFSGPYLEELNYIQ
jgi:virulence factor lipase-like protein